jgi:hypothetical protein
MGRTTFNGPVVSQNGFIDSSFTDAERDAIVNPQPGLLIYNTTSNVYQVCTVGGGTPTWDTAFGGGAVGFTYTQGTDYSSTGLLFSSSMATSLTIDTSLWSTSTATLRAEPSGSVFYFVLNNITYTFTSAATWTNISGTTWVVSGTSNFVGSVTNQPVTQVAFQTPAVVPDITSVSPSSGNVGTSVTITGTGFNGTTGVTIGGVSATITASSNTQIVVNSPLSTPNVAVNVVVTNTAGSSTEVAAFTNTSTSTPTTYSVPTDWNNSMGNGITVNGTANTMQALSFRWTNTAGYDTLVARPSGTVYTVVTASGTFTGTQSGAWGTGFAPIVSVIWDTPGADSLAGTSITFTV